jgi:hypothetical protein
MVISAEEAYLHYHVINASIIDPNPIDFGTPGVYRALPPTLQKVRLPRGTRVTVLQKGPTWSKVMWYNRKIPAWHPGKVYTKDLSPISQRHAGGCSRMISRYDGWNAPFRGVVQKHPTAASPLEPRLSPDSAIPCVESLCAEGLNPIPFNGLAK